MKKLSLIIATLTSGILLNAAQTIFVVDMGQAYSNFYKAKEANAQLNASAESTNRELEKMQKEHQEIANQIKALEEKLNNPALTDEAKKKIINEEGQPKMVKIREIETNIQNIRNQADQRLRQNAQEVRKVHMAEIQEIVKKLAADKKADFIVEKGVCYFSQPTADITQDLIALLNATEPKK